MSHSRIYQVSRSPITKENRLVACNANLNRFRVEIPSLDYYKNSEAPRDEDLSWLASELRKVGFSLSDGKITVGTDNSFIATWKDAAVNAANSFDLCGLKEVASGIAFSAMCIYDEENRYPKPLWAWARDVLENQKPGTVYHVGSILDYHF